MQHKTQADYHKQTDRHQCSKIYVVNCNVRKMKHLHSYDTSSNF